MKPRVEDLEHRLIAHAVVGVVPHVEGSVLRHKTRRYHQPQINPAHWPDVWPGRLTNLAELLITPRSRAPLAVAAVASGVEEFHGHLTTNVRQDQLFRSLEVRAGDLIRVLQSVSHLSDTQTNKCT